MKKALLATISVAALMVLPGCCKKKDKECSSQTSMKKNNCCEGRACKMDKCGSCKKHHKGKKCKEDEGKKMSYRFLDLEAADDVLL